MKKKYILFIFSLSFLFSGYSFLPALAEEPKPVKILSYNVRNTRGMDDVVDYNRVAAVIKRIDADCVALQELDSATIRSKGLIVLDELAKRTGLYASYNKSIDYQGGGYGIGVLTKEQPLRKESVTLPGREEQRSLLIVEMKDYVICCTHWSLKQPDRLASVGIIRKAVEKFTSKPVFLAGDLNAVPQSEEIAALSADWCAVNDTAAYTSPAHNPRRCIDYILVKNDPHVRIQVVGTKVENEPVASDHLPVWTKLSIKKNQ
ncbi:endonuclease/exonuclease/phosphatase family protein [Limibacterium fermenti]|uniref:endonuclease/exonuclease/phosphatase family protein n=1 Tax=Limibacterium fermenti TaxID=3229863 RepID=UPI003A5FBF86